MPKHPDCRLTCEAFLNAGKAGVLCDFCNAKGVECLGGEHTSQTEIAPEAGKHNFIICYEELCYFSICV
jgi:hypothetical protein